MRDIGVIYLWRFAEGVIPVQRFLESYRNHPAGAGHDFYVAFKGFPDTQSLQQGKAAFGHIPIIPVELKDGYYDIGSYLMAARFLPNKKLLFLNTFSRILASDWLSHYNAALNLPGIGVVGATGSWQANTSPYEALLLSGMRRISGQFRPSALSDESGEDANSSWQRPKRPLKKYLLSPFHYIAKLYEYGRYPNPHIRTNAFFIERKRFLALDFPSFTNKQDAYRFESGRRSLTKQIIALGLKPVVVDRNGIAYEMPDWEASETFWSGEQQRLIVADNRTGDYANANSRNRQLLHNSAWIHPKQWNG